MFAEDIPQTIKRTYQEIREGNDPWIAISEFSHDWYGNYTTMTQRIALVSDPVEIPQEDHPVELGQWAAFCAASVEYLCQEASMPIPSWVYNSVYILQEPFYTSPLAYKERVRQRLEQEAPEPFRTRNVFCSKRIYANKYERRLTA